VSVAGDKIAEIRKILTTPGGWGRPKYLLDHEVDPTIIALYQANPGGFDFIDVSSQHQLEALRIPSETAYAIACGASISHAEGRATAPRPWIDPADLRDMTDADRASLEELASILVDQNPFLRERKIRSLEVWALPPGSDGAPEGTWEQAFNALSRGLPVSVIERGITEAVKVRQVDLNVSPTEISTLFSGIAPPEEVSRSVFGVGETQTRGSLATPALLGVGAGALAAFVWGGPVGWAIGAGAFLASWLWQQD
jgi:hypothetical protein